MLLLLFESTSSFLIIDDGDDDFVDDDDDDEDKKKREEEEEEMGVLAAARVLDVVGDEVRRLEPPAGGFNIFVSKNARAERTQREKVCKCVNCCITKTEFSIYFLICALKILFRFPYRKTERTRERNSLIAHVSFFSLRRHRPGPRMI